MFWEEKLDRIKQEFSKSAFRDPYTDWPQILKMIERNFIMKKDGKYTFNNWSVNIKQKQKIKAIPSIHLAEELKKLQTTGNFWLVMVHGKSPTDKHLVYDCSLAPLQILLPYLFDFYIIDKKYEWLSYFSRLESTDEVVIYKSGASLTPFDQLK